MAYTYKRTANSRRWDGILQGLDAAGSELIHRVNEAIRAGAFHREATPEERDELYQNLLQVLNTLKKRLEQPEEKLRKLAKAV